MALLPDGTVMQSSIIGGDTKAHAESNYPYLVLGTVVARHFPDELTSLSKKVIEYDVQTWDPQNRFERVPMMTPRNGVNDGYLPILRPGSVPADRDAFLETDGDKVILAFLSGEISQPFILGCFPNTASGDISGVLADGETHRIKHKGATIEIKDDGEVFVQSVGGATAVLKADGNVEVFPKSGEEVLLGNTPTEFVALATKTLTELSSIITQVNTIVTLLNAEGALTGVYVPLTAAGPVTAIEVKAK